MSKVILITGSTDGIGKLAAIKLAKDGHQIILHGRNAEKLKSVVQEIKSDSNNDNIKGFVADFSDLNAIANMSQQILDEHKAIDVLINNAGIFNSSNPITKNGIDVRMVVNYLAPYILTNALLPLMKNSTDPRIVNLSSAAQATVSLDLLSGTTQAPAQQAYAQSKLAILMWSFYLAKLESEISVLALNPGSLLNTNMVREAFGRFWSSADKGADIIYDLAVLEKYKGVSGKYFDNDKGSFGPAHPDAYDEALVSTLIGKTKEILKEMVVEN